MRIFETPPNKNFRSDGFSSQSGYVNPNPPKRRYHAKIGMRRITAAKISRQRTGHAVLLFHYLNPCVRRPLPRAETTPSGCS
jgi:hypothetical protein